MDAHNITASNETLLNQAPITAERYMSEAIDRIDRFFGKDYAKNNPILVAAFMQCAAQDFQTGITARTLQDHLGAIGYALDNLANATRE